MNLKYTIRLLFGTLLISPLTACAQSPVENNGHLVMTSESQNPQCQISNTDRESLLNLDYNSFDQSLPDGGWRKFQSCPLLTRDLIDTYTGRHEKNLQKQQWDVLVWHSGQISGMAGDYTDATAKMAKTFKSSEKSTDAFLWNPYAKATIAFLKKDKPALVSERKNLAHGSSPFNHLNLRHVDAFIRCFNSSYQEAYSENCNPTETNIERVQSLAIPFDLHKPIPTDFFGMADFLKMKKIILVGEMHGTRSIPELFGNIVASVTDQKMKTLVLLEITQSSQQAIDTFLKTGRDAVLKREPFFNREYQDGRSSKAMVALLRKLSMLPNTTVLCMDPMEGFSSISGQERDSGMASFINSKRAGFDHTLVLSGNIHSSTTKGTHCDKDYRPMGYELKTMAQDLKEDDLLNVLVRYEKVDAWNCLGNKISDCGIHNGKNLATDYSVAVPDESYLVWENQTLDGHNASIFIRSIKASRPFMQGKYK